MKKILLWVLIICLAPLTVFAEGITKEQGDAILKELKAIRQELNQIKKRGLAPQGRGRPARPTTASVSTLGNPILGDLKAPVTIVEFTDYQCPFCRKFYMAAYKELKKEYIDTGKLRFVLRDLPLGFHQYAKPAAISAHCAGEQDKFWQMHDALFEGNKFTPNDILGYAKSIGLDNKAFKSCLTSGRYNEGLEQDVADANKAGITGTPGFVVGRTTDNIVKGAFISGTRPFATFKKEIDKLLQ
ncbi:MAG: DsbA family protein [Nitrospinae bacterium]|nr:DsbA family protein [Nitrospinota bacterium]MBL7020538.1 DsbA family protein [Nitrospinaceae bacterium]